MVSQHYILGIDTSCDETSLALFDTQTQKIVGNFISSQIKLHAEFGGVVPELAARAHIDNIAPLFAELLAKHHVALEELSGIAVTQTPGLMGCLLVGAAFAKALAFRLQIPLYAVNHLEAHLFSPYINTLPVFPFLGLVVSGGHTAFYRVTDFQSIELLGQTVDDAAGEAFDKGAKLLGLGYPGGPVVDRLAKQGDPQSYVFSLPRVKWDTSLMSFSGLKTAMLLHVQKACVAEAVAEPRDLNGVTLHNLCASLQMGIVQALTAKLEYFLKQHSFKAFALSGGVAMNSQLRRSVGAICAAAGVSCDLAKPEFCTDNAAMVAYVAYHQQRPVDLLNFSPKATQRVQAKTLWQEARDQKGGK